MLIVARDMDVLVGRLALVAKGCPPDGELELRIPAQTLPDFIGTLETGRRADGAPLPPASRTLARGTDAAAVLALLETQRQVLARHRRETFWMVAGMLAWSLASAWAALSFGG